MFLSLSSSLSRWFSGSTGPAASKPLSLSKRLLIFLALLIPAYLFVYAGFQAVESGYRRQLGQATGIVNVLRARRVVCEPVRGALRFRVYARPSLEGQLETKGIGSNMVFLLALILVTPGMAIANRLLRLLAGAFLLMLTHVLFISTKIEITMLAAGHPLAGSAWFWHITDNFLEITGKGFFPVLIWMGLALPYMLGKMDQRRSKLAGPPPKRNAPCPCGSGKKFKLCCGR